MLSLVVPVYKNEGSIEDLILAISKLESELEENLEAIFVVDGSPDRSFERLKKGLTRANLNSQLIALSRNFGSFAAIRVGLEAGSGERFAVMAADLQEPPEMIIQMNAAMLSDPHTDVVIGVRESRNDPWTSKLASRLFWGFYRRYVVSDIPSGGVDVFACTKKFRDSLLRLEERHSSLIAQIFWLGYKRKIVKYSRQERQHGTSAWTFKKKISYLMDSIFSFTDFPIKLLTRIGGVTALAACSFGCLVTASKILGFISVPGYAITILAIVFFGSLNIFGLGVVGSYAWRTYENTKQRPLNIVLETITYKADNDEQPQK